MKTVIAVLLACWAFAVQGASTEFGGISAAELRKWCSGAGSDVEKCHIFISGVRAGAASQRLFIGAELSRMEDEKKAAFLRAALSGEPFCHPGFKTLNNDEIRNAYVEFVNKIEKADPKMLEAAAGAALFISARNKYPCK